MNYQVVAQNYTEKFSGLPGLDRDDIARSGLFRSRAILAFGFALVIGVFGTNGMAQAQGLSEYEVTVTNLTGGEFATETDICRTAPIIGLFAFATHQPDFRLFRLGRPVSGELATLAETGSPFPLADLLASDVKVGHAFSVPAAQDFPDRFFDGVLCAGEKLKTTIQASPGHLFSMAAMIFPTNDGFIALNGVELPKKGQSVTYFSPVYDAGSESNDELCIHMPAAPGLPGCIDPTDLNSDPTVPDPHTTGGPGLGEGYAHIHSGTHGIGDLALGLFDWRNPAARIKIRRIQ